MKKILGLVVALVAVVAMLGTGTWAYFNDVVAVTDNTITAGSLYLNDVSANPVTVGDDGQFKPSATETTANLLEENGGTASEVKNAGTIDGNLYITLENLVNYENTRLDIELRSGDSTDSATLGELGSKVLVAFWFDKNMDNTWSDGDFYLNSTDNSITQRTAGSPATIAGAYATIDTYDAKAWTAIPMDSDDSFGYLKISYKFPDNTTDFYTTNVRITSGGSGYTVGDDLTLSDGSIVEVTDIDGSGAITAVSLTTGAVANSGTGPYTNVAVNPPSGGTGSGATFTANYRYNTDNVAQTDSAAFDFVLELK
jgi:predicted ribosomally synthesized peptide with SipW-like signal peptide